MPRLLLLVCDNRDNTLSDPRRTLPDRVTSRWTAGAETSPIRNISPRGPSRDNDISLLAKPSASAPTISLNSCDDSNTASSLSTVTVTCRPAAFTVPENEGPASSTPSFPVRLKVRSISRRMRVTTPIRRANQTLSLSEVVTRRVPSNFHTARGASGPMSRGTSTVISTRR